MSLLLKPIKRMQCHLDRVNTILLERTVKLRSQLDKIYERKDRLFPEQDTTDTDPIELILGPGPAETMRGFHQQKKEDIRRLAVGYWSYRLRLRYIQLQYLVQKVFYKSKLTLLKTKRALLRLPHRIYTTIRYKKRRSKTINRRKN